MPYRKVVFEPGGYYHVFNRGNNYQRIFFGRDNYVYFLRQLRLHLGSDVMDVIAYCLMPNHYHLMVCLKTDKFSNLMQRFGLSYTKAINERFGRVGSLFQGPFKALKVDREEYLLHLSAYIHLNPVAAGLVLRAEDWEFSSYREFLGVREGTLPKPSIVLSAFSSGVEYGRFVDSYVQCKTSVIEHLVIE